MKVVFTIETNLFDAENQVDAQLGRDELDELAEEMERILISYFDSSPWATEQSNHLALQALEISTGERDEDVGYQKT